MSILKFKIRFAYTIIIRTGVTVLVFSSCLISLPGYSEPISPHYLLPGMKGVAVTGYYLQIVPQDPATHTVTITMDVAEKGSAVEYKVNNETNFRLPVGPIDTDERPSLRATLDKGTGTINIVK